jgi:glucan endo-1,3-beta-D-glucosidase
MRLFHALLWLTAFLRPTSAYWKGFNIKSNLADGVTCKSASDWSQAFQLMKTFPNKINSARLYSSYSCDTLANALPAAISSDTRILVGILTEDDYDAEKGALLAAVKKYGFGWIVAVSVGSEDLYRGTTSPSALAHQIYDVRGMLSEVSGYTSEIKVGHVDTTNAWTNSSNREVIRACDFVGTDIYPYFQTKQENSIENSKSLFSENVQSVKTAVANAGSEASVWVTETGWPVNGTTKNLAVASVENAKTYWDEVACSAFSSMNTFWFTLQDYYAVPSFAVVGVNDEELFDMSC